MEETDDVPLYMNVPSHLTKEVIGDFCVALKIIKRPDLIKATRHQLWKRLCLEHEDKAMYLVNHCPQAAPVTPTIPSPAVASTSPADSTSHTMIAYGGTGSPNKQTSPSTQAVTIAQPPEVSVSPSHAIQEMVEMVEIDPPLISSPPTTSTPTAIPTTAPNSTPNSTNKVKERANGKRATVNHAMKRAAQDKYTNALLDRVEAGGLIADEELRERERHVELLEHTIHGFMSDGLLDDRDCTIFDGEIRRLREELQLISEYIQSPAHQAQVKASQELGKRIRPIADLLSTSAMEYLRKRYKIHTDSASM